MNETYPYYLLFWSILFHFFKKNSADCDLLNWFLGPMAWDLQVEAKKLKLILVWHTMSTYLFSKILCLISAILFLFLKFAVLFSVFPFHISFYWDTLLPTWLYDKFSSILLNTAETLLKVVYNDKNKRFFSSSDNSLIK